MWENYKKTIYSEADKMNDFMYVLMKQRNKRGKWTEEEIGKLRQQVSVLSVKVPFSIIVIYPLGFMLMPLLAALLDRRKAPRPFLQTVVTNAPVPICEAVPLPSYVKSNVA